MNRKLALLTTTLSALGIALLSPQATFADGGGGWIGDSGVGGGDGSSGGSINVSDCGKNNRYRYMLECSGYSWIFYKSTGQKIGSVDFVPYTESSRKVTIPRNARNTRIKTEVFGI